jgi:hypothetical protein
MQNSKGFGFLATLATLARMCGYRSDKPKAPRLNVDRSAPPGLRDTKRSRYTRHQGARECARRQQQDQLMFYPSLAALLRDDDGQRRAA